jgi:hypothetical protein
MEILYYIASLASLVCGIAVLIKLFQKEGALKGILGFICMLYTYIWGWINIKDESLNLKNWMYAWTAVIILNLILAFFVQGQLQAG